MANTKFTLTTKNFEPLKLTLEDPEEVLGRKGSWSSKLKYDDEYFLLQTHKLFTPFGAKSFNNDDRYALTFSLGKEAKDAELKKMLLEFSKRVQELVTGLKSRKLNKLNFSSLVRESSEPEKFDPTF